MSLLTSRRLGGYYSLYKDTEVILTREIAQALRLDARQISVKCSDEQWPCVIYSLSLSQAKIIIRSEGGAFDRLIRDKTSTANLFFSFTRPRGAQLSFFVTAKIMGAEPYSGGSAHVVLKLAFSQRPPDDLIDVLGAFLETRDNFAARKTESIPVTAESRRRLGLRKDEAVITVGNESRACLVRELSFAGARAAVAGDSAALTGKPVILKMVFDDGTLDIPGVVTGTEPVRDRCDIFVADIQFSDAATPAEYRAHISGYLSAVKPPLPEAL